MKQHWQDKGISCCSWSKCCIFSIFWRFCPSLEDNRETGKTRWPCLECVRLVAVGICCCVYDSYVYRAFRRRLCASVRYNYPPGWLVWLLSTLSCCWRELIVEQLQRDVGIWMCIVADYCWHVLLCVFSGDKRAATRRGKKTTSTSSPQAGLGEPRSGQQRVKKCVQGGRPGLSTAAGSGERRQCLHRRKLLLNKIRRKRSQKCWSKTAR